MFVLRMNRVPDRRGLCVNTLGKERACSLLINEYQKRPVSKLLRRISCNKAVQYFRFHERNSSPQPKYAQGTHKLHSWLNFKTTFYTTYVSSCTPKFPPMGQLK